MAGAAGLAAFLDAVAIVADAFECPWAGAVTAFGDRSTDTEIGSKSVRSAIPLRDKQDNANDLAQTRLRRSVAGSANGTPSRADDSELAG